MPLGIAADRVPARAPAGGAAKRERRTRPYRRRGRSSVPHVPAHAPDGGVADRRRACQWRRDQSDAHIPVGRAGRRLCGQPCRASASSPSIQGSACHRRRSGDPESPPPLVPWHTGVRGRLTASKQPPPVRELEPGRPWLRVECDASHAARAIRTFREIHTSLPSVVNSMLNSLREFAVTAASYSRTLSACSMAGGPRSELLFRTKSSSGRTVPPYNP